MTTSATATYNRGYLDLDAFLMQLLGLPVKQACLIAKLFWMFKGRPVTVSARWMRDRFFGGRGSVRSVQLLIARVVDQDLIRKIGQQTARNGLDGAAVYEFTNQLQAALDAWLEHKEGGGQHGVAVASGTPLGQTQAAAGLESRRSADDQAYGVPVSERRRLDRAGDRRAAGRCFDDGRDDPARGRHQGDRVQPGIQRLVGTADTPADVTGDADHPSQMGRSTGPGDGSASANLLTPPKPAENLAISDPGANIGFAQGVTKNHQPIHKIDKQGALGADAPQRQWQPGERIDYIRSLAASEAPPDGAYSPPNRTPVHDWDARKAHIAATKWHSLINNLILAMWEALRDNPTALDAAGKVLNRAMEVDGRKGLDKSDRKQIDAMDRVYRTMRANGWQQPPRIRNTWNRFGGKPAAERPAGGR